MWKGGRVEVWKGDYSMWFCDMAYFIWPWWLFGGYSAQAIKEFVGQKLKSADNPYVSTNELL